MVSTIAVTDHDGVSRTVNTLDIVSVVEDAAAAANPTGITMMAVRRDTLVTNEVSATDDVIAVKASSRGEIHVNLAAHAASPTKLEDAAHTTADMGMAVLGVRRDAAASGADTDGDYATINLDATGRLWCNIASSATSIAKNEDAAHSTADTGVAILGVRRDTAASGADTDGDYATINLDANGKLYTNTTVLAAATNIAKAEDAAHTSGETGVFCMGVRADASATTATTDGDYTAFTMDALGKLWVAAGQAAHDAAIVGSPVRIGARALTANYTGVATGDQADLVCTTVGALINKPYSIPGADWSYAAAASGITNTTTAVTIKAAAAAGLKNYITWIELATDLALATATEVAIRDGAGGAVLWRTKIGTAGLMSGRFIALPTPISGTAATLLEVVTLTGFATGTLYFNAGGYAAP